MNKLPEKIKQHQIFATFQKYGYQPQSMISEEKMRNVFSQQYSKCTGRAINQQLLKQIWNESQATTKGQIAISTIVKIITQAQDILEKRIARLVGPSGMIEDLRSQIVKDGELLDLQMRIGNNEQKEIILTTKQYANKKLELNQLQTDLTVFREYYLTINAIFSNQNLRLSAFPNANTQYINPYDQSRFNQSLLAPHSYSYVRLPQKQLKKQSSGRLLTLFHLTNVLLFLQFCIMSSLRISMVPITAYLHSLIILISGFKQNSVNFLLAHYSFTVLADIVFIILKILNKYVFVPYEHSSYTIYILVTHVLLVVSILIRLFSIFLYSSFRNSLKDGVIYFFPLMSYNLPTISENIHATPNQISVYTERTPINSNSANPNINPNVSPIAPGQNNQNIVPEIKINPPKPPNDKSEVVNYYSKQIHNEAKFDNIMHQQIQDLINKPQRKMRRQEPNFQLQF